MLELCDAVVNSLIAGFTNPVLTSLNCAVQFEGHPPPVAGTCYVSVDEGGVTTPADAQQFELSERYDVFVWISVRIAETPGDRSRNLISRLKESLQKMERKAISLIHGQQSIRQAANVLLADRSAGTGEFQTPLYYSGRSATEQKGPGWSLQDGDDQAGWLVRRLVFRGGLRIQYMDTLT